MVQSTLDAFVAPTASGDTAAEQRAMGTDRQNAARADESAPAPKGVPRVRVAGTSTVAGVIEAAREQHPGASVFLVALSWRHNHLCGADKVIVACEARGAALDLRPPPRPKKGEPKEPPSTPGIEELSALINAGEEIADLLQDERAQVVVTDGYPQGQIYARFVACIAARCIKLRGESKRVALPRATAPADATCKALLARFKACRSIEKMRAAAIAYHEEELADRFP